MSAHLEIHTNKTNLKKRKSFPFTKGDLNTQEVRLEKVFKDLKQFSFHDLIYRFVTSLKFRTPTFHVKFYNIITREHHKFLFH